MLSPTTMLSTCAPTRRQHNIKTSNAICCALVKKGQIRYRPEIYYEIADSTIFRPAFSQESMRLQPVLTRADLDQHGHLHGDCTFHLLLHKLAQLLDLIQMGLEYKFVMHLKDHL